ncbi:hypothetical protein [Treponema sp.]|uniref:hypothetical protein n=1 Tax=Treponema sp. TaxID=166 RepID=UPI00388E6824
MRRSVFFIVFLIMISLFSGCDLPVKTSYNHGNNSSVSKAEKKNELFKKQANDSLTYIFETNNEDYLKESGYTLWSENYTNTSENFERIICKQKKESGDSKAGYGIVFCCLTKSPDENYLLTVMINNEGEYNVGKVVNGFFLSISNGWKECMYLKRSLENKIEVNYITAGEHVNKFELKLNDVIVMYFSDSENDKPVFKNTKSGFVACIGPSEDFEYGKVNVVFEMLK